MAEKTGGHFYRARNTAELAQIYAEIDKLEPSADAQEQFRPIDELFHWPLAGALLIALLIGLRSVPVPRMFAAKAAQ
jgi:Ca-activated chloride channel family protein